jgi:hypothetical protein
MSTGSKRSTVCRIDTPPNRRNRSPRDDLNGFALVLWEIGASEIDDTQRQLRIARRICAEREMFDGGGRQ